MKRPKCAVLMNEVARAGVLVDLCPRGRGMWLDRGELEKISGRLRDPERDRDDDERGREPALRRAEDFHRSVGRRRCADLFDIFD